DVFGSRDLVPPPRRSSEVARLRTKWRALVRVQRAMVMSSGSFAAGCDRHSFLCKLFADSLAQRRQDLWWLRSMYSRAALAFPFATKLLSQAIRSSSVARPSRLSGLFGPSAVHTAPARSVLSNHSQFITCTP